MKEDLLHLNHKSSILVFLVWFLFFPSNLWGLTCANFNAYYFFRCTGEDCIPEFQAKEIEWLGGCKRQLILEEVPKWSHSIYKKYLYEKLNTETPIGIYRISLTNRRPIFPENPIELNAWIDLLGFAPQLKKISSQSDQQELEKQRSAWEQQSRRDQNKEQIRKLIDYCVMGISSLFLLVCTRRFFKNLKQRYSDNKVFEKLSRNLGIQYLFIVFTIFTTPIMWIFSFYSIYWVPLAILILGCETTIYFIFKRNRQLTISPS